MAGSILGKHFSIQTFGESHGEGVGVVIDGCPAGLELNASDIQIFLDRRKPGQTKFATPRKEDDKVEILSGLFEGKTTGAPIALFVHNTSQRPKDYAEIASCYRPGHADYTYDQKYGFRDYRGGGRSSARETVGRVAAGAIASKLLSELGISVCAYTKSIGPIAIDYDKFNLENILSTPTAMPDADASKKAEKYLERCMAAYDSAGGIIECRINGVPAGIGEPVFDKLSANLAKSIMSVGAVKGFEIGDGFAVSVAKGSENNDSFYMENGAVKKKTNHSGGVLGGISDGSEIILRAHIKPTPSIFSEQQTVSRDGKDVTLKIKGRHDPVIVPRAVVVIESMAALTVLDLMIENMSAKLENIIKIYRSETDSDR